MKCARSLSNCREEVLEKKDTSSNLEEAANEILRCHFFFGKSLSFSSSKGGENRFLSDDTSKNLTRERENVLLLIFPLLVLREPET